MCSAGALEILSRSRCSGSGRRWSAGVGHVLLPAAHRHPRHVRRTPGCSSASAPTWCRAWSGSASATGSRASPRSRSAWRWGCRGRLRRALDPVVQFLRSIPPPALLPFGILVLGVGTSMKVFIIAFVCLWPVLLNTDRRRRGRRPDAARDRRVYGIAAARPRPARDPAGRRAADLRRDAHEPVARADPDGDLRDGREHERHRLLRARSPSAASRSPRCGPGSCCWGSSGTC